jgi:cytochrome bd-type quinol oxidase subunit 2
MKERLAKISSKAVATVTMVAGSATAAFAVDSPLGWISGIQGQDEELNTWVVDLINWAIGLAALAAVVMLIAAGFLYITASGDENKIGKATKTLTFAIVGLVICFIAVMLVNFVLNQWLGGAQ